MIKNGRICYDTTGEEIVKGDRFHAVSNNDNDRVDLIVHFTDFPSGGVEIIQHADGRVEQRQQMCEGFIATNGQQVNPDFIARECKIYDVIDYEKGDVVRTDEREDSKQ